jgi:microcompartment protein CcmL/EutN
MLAEGPLSTVRAAIDDVTERAASISRASDMLVHDRVDELTQVFVENAAALADVSDATKISSAAKADREARSARSMESGDRGEPRASN